MADAAVQFLLENLKQLLLNSANLIHGVNNEVESLYQELSMLKAFLKDSTEKRTEYEVVKQLVRQIRDVTYEAEDVIDIFLFHAAVQNARGRINRAFHNMTDYPAKLHKAATDIQSIRHRVKQIYDNKWYGFEAQQSGESSISGSREKRAPVVEEENVVGFHKETKMLVDQLIGEQKELEVISVVGMGGLGKTTLARKVYTDPDVDFNFRSRAWIFVSQEYNRKEVFLGILSQVSQVTADMYKMSADSLAQVIRTRLESGRYLIVLDDVWTNDAWDALKNAFPNKKNGSRIVLTSRETEVAKHANPDKDAIHNLRFLTEDESWELLQLKVFRKGSCPSDRESTLGKKIVKQCGGLPLAVVVVAGLLLKKVNSDDWWNKVAESVRPYVARDPKQFREVLALSYKHLPYHLKACFLYFGVFPEDFQIPVWKLIRLWVAEGLIMLPIGEENLELEEIAEEHLEDLVDRNLVLVEKWTSNGRIKACRIHDMLRDLCLKEAAEEKFFEEIKGAVQNYSSSSTPIPNNHSRRICIHSHLLNYISSKPSHPHVRSFLCFASDETDMPLQLTSFIPRAFQLLRVLDIRSITFSRFPSEIKHMIHLRYIAFCGNFNILPAAIYYLWNIQTLIVETTSRTLEIQADIWKLLRLRHLHINGSSSHLHDPPTKVQKSNEVRGDLQTISTISPESCTDNLLAMTRNLKKLGIRGKLVRLMEFKGRSNMFDNLAKLDRLKTLKLWNDTFPDPPSKGRLRGLPQQYKFPPNLKKLTLLGTLLDWEHMSTLGMLPNLEVLKLKDSAFMGQSWQAADGGFRKLKVLQLGRTDLVSWTASGRHFPKLQRLILNHCTTLVEIPSSLGNIATLQMMELYFPTRSVVASARLIQQQSVVNNGLKLLIYPPDL
ncbi:hypothetical protein F0562_034336 [Nyssa sinensis]|uniref:NB-ARC domain-containing protein n=1 Tax=Nyssa sinensis TaxID=561372 RepID=A0A5J5AJY6_9ASTE|nr:hypothetical protein F0562_034336 [Nyssa sinensis]